MFWAHSSTAEQGSYKAKVPGSNPGAPTGFSITGGWRSWLARVIDIDEVRGSNPLPPTKKPALTGFLLAFLLNFWYFMFMGPVVQW